ncbi:MAG: peptidoglycan-associated lipoprotein Pal [Candidatus Methylomirabilales bacterium]
MRLPLEVGLLVGCLLLFGCPKRSEVVQAPPALTGPAAGVVIGERVQEAVVQPVPAPPAPAVVQETVKEEVQVVETVALQEIFFDFDKATIREDQKAALDANGSILKANPNVKVLIEGHCDERGTVEYNLGLGERRAKAVRDYLVAGGIPAERIAIVSYGKERPFVLGHDESAWKWNRRGHVVIQGP